MSGARGMGAAVVGTGFGCLTHVRALRAAGFDVVALVGRDPERTRERAGRFAVPHPCTSLAEALSRDDVEVVTVATPPATHRPIVEEVVGSGRHVVCEKPFSVDADEARRMLAAAEDAGVVHLVGTEFRFSGGQALLRRAVADGLIGTPRLATFMLHMPLLADPAAEVPGWWSDAGQSGGWLGAHAAHVIDQVRTTLGEITGVSAGLNVVSDHAWSAEDSYTVHFRAGEVEGVMQSSAGSFGDILVTTRISGTGGTLSLEGDRVFLANASGKRELPLPDDLRTGPADPPPPDLLVTAYDWMHSTGIDMGPYTRLFEVFRDLIDGKPVPDDPAPATFVDGVATMEVMDAVRRASAERTWVGLP